MKRKIHNPELIVKKLREADAVIASGGDLTPYYVPHAIRELPTYSVVYCWSIHRQI